MNKKLSFIPFGAPTLPSLDGNNILEIFEKAARYEEVLKANGRLAERVGELEHQLAEVKTQEKEESLVPSFPEDFEYFGNVGELSDAEVQALVIEIANKPLEEGEFFYSSMGDTAVIRMNDGDKIYTVVGQGFFEHQETVADTDNPLCAFHFN